MPPGAQATLAARTLAVGVGEVCQSSAALPCLWKNFLATKGTFHHPWMGGYGCLPWQPAACLIEERPRCAPARLYPGLSALLEGAAQQDEQPFDAAVMGFGNAAALEAASPRGVAPPVVPSPRLDEPEPSQQQRPTQEQYRCMPLVAVATPEPEVALVAPVQVHAPEPKPTPAPTSPAPGSLTVPASTIKSYEARLRRLEDRCSKLAGENVVLRVEAAASKARQKNLQELNIRLTREVQEARHERDILADKMGRLAKDRQEQSRQAEPSLEPAPEESAALILAYSGKPAEAGTWSRTLTPPPGLETRRQLPIEVFDAMDDVVGPFPEEGPCGCAGLVVFAAGMDASAEGADVASWACEQHRVYSARLLLAHRDVQARIAQGPPGLSLDQDALSTGAKLDGGTLGPRLIARTRPPRAAHRGLCRPQRRERAGAWVAHPDDCLQ